MTDWDQEATLKKEYIGWLVDNNLTSRLLRHEQTESAKGVLEHYFKMGIMFVRNIPTEFPDQIVISYERWLETKNIVI